jgi:hypothetical protein
MAVAMILDLHRATDIVANQDRSLIETIATSEPDPNWIYVDANGHEHRWSKSGTLPTLEHVVDAYDTDWEGDSWPSVTHYECKRCGEHVEPGSRAVNDKRIQAGHDEYVVVRRPLRRVLGATSYRPTDHTTRFILGPPSTARPLPSIGLPPGCTTKYDERA